MNNATTAHPCNDADDNKNSDVQEEEANEKSADMANNCELTSHNNVYNIMLFICISY